MTRSHGPWRLAALTALAWMAQGAASWYVAAHACPSGERQWPLGVARVVIVALTLVALAISIWAIVRATRTLANTEPLPEGKQVPTAADALSEQKRFTALVTLVAGAALTLGLAFAGLSALVIRVCGETR
jgi:hypothetical protein